MNLIFSYSKQNTREIQQPKNADIREYKTKNKKQGFLSYIDL